MDVDNIQSLIPQRHPILMIDRLISVDELNITTSFVVREDNYFIDNDGLMVEVGIIENIAQSASAFAGYWAKARGGNEIPVGYICEVRNFVCHRRPNIGDELFTAVHIGAEIGGVTIITGETSVGGERIAEAQMKIYVN